MFLWSCRPLLVTLILVPEKRKSPVPSTPFTHQVSWAQGTEQSPFHDQQGPDPEGSCSQGHCFLPHLVPFQLPLIMGCSARTLLFARLREVNSPARLLPAPWAPRAGGVFSRRGPEGLLFTEVLQRSDLVKQTRFRLLGLTLPVPQFPRL